MHRISLLVSLGLLSVPAFAQIAYERAETFDVSFNLTHYESVNVDGQMGAGLDVDGGADRESQDPTTLRIGVGWRF